MTTIQVIAAHNILLLVVQRRRTTHISHELAVVGCDVEGLAEELAIVKRSEEVLCATASSIQQVLTALCLCVEVPPLKTISATASVDRLVYRRPVANILQFPRSVNDVAGVVTTIVVVGWIHVGSGIRVRLGHRGASCHARIRAGKQVLREST